MVIKLFFKLFFSRLILIYLLCCYTNKSAYGLNLFYLHARGVLSVSRPMVHVPSVASVPPIFMQRVPQEQDISWK
jgi:hypothetical protein